MTTVLRTLAVLAVLGAVGGAATVFIGLYNVSARVGHMPGVSWVLHTTYRNAAALRAPPESEVPDLSDPAMVALGALHFDGACRVCHAAPGKIRSATARSLVPEPPHIQDAVEEWEPHHLHWIVDEGIKMTGMPHWPADRDEEIWPVIAFLEAASEMTEAEYDALIRAPEEAEDAEDTALAYCAACHGLDGVGDLGPHVPRLDIQNEAYLAASLEAYRADRRASGIMQHAATLQAPEALARLAEYFGARSPDRVVGTPPAELVAEGALLAGASGSDDVPACRACHGPDPTRTAAGTPSLSGQHRAYLQTQLRLWRDGARGGGRRANLMHLVAQDLTDDDIAALAAYYASLPPAKLADPVAGRP